MNEKKPTPKSMITTPKIISRSLIGNISPYPTVEKVVNAK